MKLNGFRQKGHSRSLWSASSLQVLVLSIACTASAAPSLSAFPLVPAANICTMEAATEWKASLKELMEAQTRNTSKAREILFGFYIPEISKIIQELPASEREQLAANILVWLVPENFEKGLELKSRAAEALSPEEISQLISFETCWQSLLGYVLTINPEYREEFDIFSGANYFNEPLEEVAKVDQNRYLVFLINGTIKLTEILRSAKVLASLAELKGQQLCAQLPSSESYIQQAHRPPESPDKAVALPGN